MYEVSHLYIVNRHDIQVIAAQKMDPITFRSHIELNTHLYIAVRSDKKKNGIFIYQGLDYSHMITDFSDTITDTWRELNDLLTDSLVLGYETTIPGYLPGSDKPKHQIVSWDAMNTLNTFDLDYGDAKSGRHGIFAIRWSLKDLRISLQTGASPVPKLKNCLPIVNGVCCRPIYKANENVLFAQNGAKMSWQEEDHRTPEVQLLDFSELGDIEVDSITHVKGDIRDDHTHIDFRNRQNRYDTSCAWAITTNRSLYEYTPIIVCCGIPVWPDQYIVTGENRLTIDAYKIPFNFALLMEQYFGDDTNTDADISFETVDLPDYLEDVTDISRAEPPFDFFIIYVKTPKIYVNRIYMDVWDNSIIMNLYAKEGILIHNATGSVRVFHKDTMSDRHELVIQNLSGFAVADMKFPYKQYGAFPGDVFARKHMRNIMKSDCTMLHVMR